MRLRNDSGYPLTIRRYNRKVQPTEVIDTAELVDAEGPYDPAVHGPITGFTVLDDDPAEAPSKRARPGKAAAGSTGEETAK